MDTHNICPYEEVDKNYTGCNLKTTELLECVLIGACAVMRSNTVCTCWHPVKSQIGLLLLCTKLKMIQFVVSCVLASVPL